MKSNYVLAILFVLSINAIHAQKTYTSISDSDKEALRIFNKTKDILKNAKTSIFDYSFLISIPDNEPQLTNGVAKQKGDKYYIEMGDKTIYCNGKNIQMYSQIQNEVQINDIDEESGLLTPSSILDMFKEDSYIFILSQDKKINNRKYFNIIFKPVEKFSEYTKIEVLIDKKTYLPFRIKMLHKDGLRNTLDIKSASIDKPLDDSIFEFQIKNHPDISVEDLRMN